jgi:FAD-dependent urate hydroxylase
LQRPRVSDGFGGYETAWSSDAAPRRGNNDRMTERLDVAILGAGPYGMSVAAHLRDRRSVRTFGAPMQTWRTRMPPDMRLRSAWHETSFSAPGGAGTFDHWAAATDEPREEPIPLQKFLRYADWFCTKFAGDVDPSDVARVEPANGRFHLTTAQGDEVEAATLVLAVGAVPFAAAPESLAQEMGEEVRFATDLQDYSSYESRRVVVVGGGQGGLESALLAARAGADVQLVIRSQLHWFTDREPHNRRGPLGQRLYRLAYPVIGYGPPPLNRLVLHPDLFAALPGGIRRRLTARVLRAGGSPWLREAVERSVRIRSGAAVDALERRNGDLRVRLTDGSTLETDAVIVAAGFRFSLDRLSFLSPAIRAGIALDEGWPVLDRWFRSTDPNLLFVGFASERRFGPIVRFIPGTRFSAPRVQELLGD